MSDFPNYGNSIIHSIGMLHIYDIRGMDVGFGCKVVEGGSWGWTCTWESWLAIVIIIHSQALALVHGVATCKSRGNKQDGGI